MAENQGAYAVRRIFLRDEAEQIFDLQATAPVFRRHYPEHAKWLRMAIDEILEGRRFAFGIYVPEVRSGTAVDLKLAGSIILKSETYSKVMQLKNLYIDNKYRGAGLGTQLFHAVERFCVKRGSTAIDTEVPVEEKTTVSFLNHLGFLVHAHLDSPYMRGDVLYRMYKPLPRMYTCDPFDLMELARWTLDVGLGFQIDNVTDDAIDFSRAISANGRLPSENTGEPVSLTGVACVCDQATEIVPQQLKKMVDSHTRLNRSVIIVSGRRFSDAALKAAARYRFLCLSREDLDRSLSRSYPFAAPSFDKEQIGGILAPIKSAYLYRLNTTQNQERTYFKGGPVGKFLKPGNTIFFYVESDKTANAAILAKATIRNTIAGSPTMIWDQSWTRNPIFEERSQYDTWSSDKTDVVAITYTNLERIEALRRTELQGLSSLERLEDDQVGTFYLSSDDVNLLLSKCRPARSEPQGIGEPPNRDAASLRRRLTNGELPQLVALPLILPSVEPVEDQKLPSLLAATEVLIVTAAQVELDATLSALEPRSNETSVLSGFKGQAAYHFGRLGGCSVAVVKCKAGSNRRDGATLTVRQAIDDCNPCAVIAVGIAFGGYTEELRIGDVLISEQIIPYDIRRVGVGEEHHRGGVPEAGPVLLNRFTNALRWEFKRSDGYTCKVKLGPLLSGDTLLDNLDEKVRLFRTHPSAIGGEMEAAGIYAAASRHESKKEWIVVKSVCDWGDGTKKARGDTYQPLAASASVSLVKFVLSLPSALAALQVYRSGT